MEHVLNIAQRCGGKLKRMYQYLKPENFVWCSVQIKNLMTQQIYQYDEYHDQIGEGPYALFFLDENGETMGKYKLEVNEKTLPTINIVFEHHSGDYVTVKQVDMATLKEMTANKELMHPRGYDGC